MNKDGRQLKSVIWTEFKYFSLTKGKSVKHSNELMGFFREIVLGGNGDIRINDFDERVKKIKAQFV